MNKIISKVLKPSINDRVCYCRVPISRKIMGTGARDSEILINSGIPKSMSDLSFHLSSGTYSLDSTLANKKDYCASFSTTQLLQLLPSTFNHEGTLFGIMLHPGEIDGFGRRSLVGIVINMSKIKNFKDLVFIPHPIAGEAQKLPLYLAKEYAEAKQAKMNFENGYGISVIFGSMFYSNGIDTYEVGILKDGILCYATPITDDVIGYITADEVTDIMRKIQELPID